MLPVPGGLALRHSRFPDAHDHNQLVLWSAVSAPEVAAAADAVRDGPALRGVHVQDAALADGLAAGLAERGWCRSDELLMAYRGDPPLPQPVVALGLDERVGAATRSWAAEQPGWPAETVAQLGGRIATAVGVAEPVFLAVRDGGEVVARADLLVRGGVAQVEEVVTEPAARGRGHASALVREAVRRALEAGAGLVVLVADADDWPAGLYRRLGFADLGRTTTFSR